ncbi:MAG TPA: lasso peptide biosynthesis B2 protein [Pyrinomonadaceae bacterium]|jgi:hypothetical protein|nr:lasso peptide biosynthesis B2 protein [Pyrinomonadaceae bacterium]
MTVETVSLKPGVLFLPTLSGGILMDVAADRFVALTPLSATIWNGLASGHNIRDIIDQISSLRGVRADQAEALLRRQLLCWENAELTQCRQPASPLPQPKTSLTRLATELSMESLESEPLVPWLAALLFYEELKYRRTISRRGLAVALVTLQSECGPPAVEAETTIMKTVRNYYLLRRGFRQGAEARDCLFRSFALAALLRRQGVNADLCFGIIDLPFSSHAWVEAEGRVLNETPRSCGRYAIIGRF